jgi:hypothetical protein
MATKLAQLQWHQEHHLAVQNQTKLTQFMFMRQSHSILTLASSSLALLRARLRAPSIPPSHMQSNMPSHTQSNMPSLAISVPSDSPLPPEAESESENRSDAEAEEEEEDMVEFLDNNESQQQLRVVKEIHSWPELRERIKADQQRVAHKDITLTKINQLMILHNFVTLQIKGLGHMATSKEIIWQWHDGKDTHLACQIWMLTCYYQ